ncbi:nuclear transport factor 2 family protein [Thalassolituus hydrocarboniclasticus]|uniref:Nuclear transport factor 2 family protein n=1 Tax=Thalassolituus hydrocarboniclasticus TaxID=2742796 RepID=A0ABY6AD04_9GAMM|nr:nuclear transport factor 2 family protein [Thalassolituus hydrocarboniclasticus]UXD88473.1 nuclear transport factor 2 family protein [Thalassolituus hydrocarboniclasticus]
MNTQKSLLQSSETERFQNLYHVLNRDTVSADLLKTCYADSIMFCDPFHEIQGIDALTDYFTAMYSNVNHIDFIFTNCWHQTERSMLRWTMNFRHPRLRHGDLISVEGCSELRWENDRIVYHRDFFDAGAMLYENIPLFGWAIRKLKERM